MKAIQVKSFGGPEVLQLAEIPTPQPGPRQILVEVNAIGVNPVDTYCRGGIHGFAPHLPFIPGFDAAGVVKEIGQEVKSVKVGQRVYVGGSVTGTYAEFVLCEENQVHPLSEHLSFEQGAAINIPYATAYRALFVRGKALAREKVLIHGASGGVGIAAVQLAKAYGLQIIGTAGSEEGVQLIKKEGAHFYLNHHEPDYREKIKEIGGEEGIELIIEMLANVNLGKDLPLLKKGGRAVVVGCRGTVEIDPRTLMANDGSILGMSLHNASSEELYCIHAALQAGFENGTLKPIVGQKFSLAEASKAHQAIMEPGAYGKIVLTTASPSF